MNLPIDAIAHIISPHIIRPFSSIVTGISIDTRTLVPGTMFIALRGERDGHAFVDIARDKGAVAYCVSQQISEEYATLHGLHNVIIVHDTTKALHTIARWYLKKVGPTTIGITGSCGKTSVKDMLFHCVRETYHAIATQGNLNNHLGVPLTISRLDGTENLCILELGINHPEEMRTLAEIVTPDIAVITGIGKAHLEHFKTQDGVLNAKWELVQHIKKNGVLVINGDDELLRAKIRDVQHCRVITFGMREHNDVVGLIEEKTNTTQRLRVTLNNHGRDVLSCTTHVVGTLGAYNTLATIAAAVALGMDLTYCAQRVATYMPNTAMRFHVSTVRGITIINDAYNANPTSMAAGLQAFAEQKITGKKIAVLGDMLELGDAADEEHRTIGARVAQLGIDMLVCCGIHAEKIIEGAEHAGFDTTRRVWIENNKHAVVDFLKKHAVSGDAIFVKASRGMKLEEIIEEFEKVSTNGD